MLAVPGRAEVCTGCGGGLYSRLGSTLTGYLPLGSGLPPGPPPTFWAEALARDPTRQPAQSHPLGEETAARHDPKGGTIGHALERPASVPGTRFSRREPAAPCVAGSAAPEPTPVVRWTPHPSRGGAAPRTRKGNTRTPNHGSQPLGVRAPQTVS